MKSFLSKAGAFLLAILLTVIPYAGFRAPVLSTLEDDCVLNLEIISDTHVEVKEPARKGFLIAGLKSLNQSKSPIDAVVIPGDLTNYADEPSLAKFFEIIEKYSPVPCVVAAGNHDIGHAGDRNVTDISREEALANFIRYRNEYYDMDNEVNYYSTEIKGFKFIVLGDEVVDGGHWDAISMNPEQLEFLDRELADGSKDGKPVFVISHWPLDNINGEGMVHHADLGIEQEEYDIKSIMEKYENVVYISGHMHAGFRSKLFEKVYGNASAEKVNGVVYLNLPTFGLVNWYGLPQSGTGAQLEIYENKLIFRPRNYLTGFWFKNCEYSFDFDAEFTAD